jgi:FAD/FMN-containing dehydrogenase
MGVLSLTTAGGDDAAAWWTWLADFPAAMQISTLPSRTVELMAGLRELLPQCCLQAHAGNGLIRVQWPPPGDNGELAALLHDRLCPLVAAAGGRLTSERTGDRGQGIGENKDEGERMKDESQSLIPNPQSLLMRELKQRFDPAGLLNPGRFASC